MDRTRSRGWIGLEAGDGPDSKPRMDRSLFLAGATPAAQPIHGHFRTGTLVCKRVVVERPIEIERRGRGAGGIWGDVVDRLGLRGKSTVIGDRKRRRRGIAKRPTGLGGAANHPAISVALIPTDERGSQSRLIVLERHRVMRLGD